MDESKLKELLYHLVDRIERLEGWVKELMQSKKNKEE